MHDDIAMTWYWGPTRGNYVGVLMFQARMCCRETIPIYYSFHSYTVTSTEAIELGIAVLSIS